MNTRRLIKRRLWVEELEPRVVLSTSPGIVPALLHSVATTSTNWSGYAAETNLNSPQNNAVSAVSGSWTVPSVSGAQTAFSSIWVGIDGYSSNTVQQIGTDSDIVNGQPQYYAWYEMYPKDSFNVTSLTIHANDSISASVTYIGSNQFLLQLADITTGKSFSITQTAAATQRSSAEWIVEAPSSGFGVLPLANFGTANITGASATINGKTGPIDNPAWQNASINMVSPRGVSEATTSALNDKTTTSVASSFSVTYVPPEAPTSPPPRRHHWWWQTNATTAPQDDGTPNNPTASAAVAQAAPRFDLNPNLIPGMAGTGFGAATAPLFIDTAAFPQNVPAAAFFQGAGSTTANLRLSSFAESNLDMPDTDVLLPQLQEAPAPAAQPMPNREMPPNPQEPMQPDMSSRGDNVPAIVNAEASSSDFTTESRAVRSGGLLRAFASLLGLVGAFTLFHGGGFLARSRSAEKPEPCERERLHAK